MTAFFASVLIAALQDPKVQAFLQKMFGDAAAELQTALLARVGELEQKVLDRVAGLPGEILGDATKDVGILLHEITGTKDDIAGAVKGEVQPLFKPIVDVLGNLPGGGILGTIFGR